MILPCGHDTDLIPFKPGTRPNTKGECARCWYWLNHEPAKAVYESSPNPPPMIQEDPGLGDVIERALEVIGVTKSLVENWVGGPCRCVERKEKLNALGRWASRVLKGSTEKAEEFLHGIMGTILPGTEKRGVRDQREITSHQIVRSESPNTTTIISVGEPGMKKWAYGVTATLDRLTLLDRTLRSLRESGFDKPRLFIDGCSHRRAAELEERLKLPIIARSITEGQSYGVRAFGNWILSLWEIYIREPHCDMYAIFQDDIVVAKGLKEFLSRSRYPEKGYWNLYTCSENQGTCPRLEKGKGNQVEGWFPTTYARKGIGALGIVFDKATLLNMLSARSAVEKPQNIQNGWCNIDGQVFAALDQLGYKEYVHNPSLVQHTGMQSTLGNASNKKALSFRGEGWDAREMLVKK